MMAAVTKRSMMAAVTERSAGVPDRTDIVQQVGNMKLKPKPPCKVFNENDRSFLEFDPGEDKVMEAILKNDVTALKQALEIGFHYALINIPRIDIGPPIFVACDRGYMDCLKVLMDTGADPLSSNAEFRTGIHQASLKGHIHILDYIFETAEMRDDDNLTSEFANHLTTDGRTPLHYAAMPAPDSCDKVVLVTYLLNRGATPLHADKNGDLPCDLCTDTKTLRLLYFAMRFNLTPEEEISFFEDEDNGEHKDREVEPQKSESSSNDYEISYTEFGVPCISMKFDKVMDAVLKDDSDNLRIALEEDAAAGRSKLVDMHRDTYLGPPLVVACTYSYKKCVEVLLQFGADPLACGPDFITSIHAAAFDADMEILELLFNTAHEDDRRTKVFANHRTWLGLTPLHFAVKAKSNSIEAVRFLLMKNAKPLLADRNKLFPADCCVDGNTQDLLLMAEELYGGRA